MRRELTCANELGGTTIRVEVGSTCEGVAWKDQPFGFL